jgi:hypothetical protein
MTILTAGARALLSLSSLVGPIACGGASTPAAAGDTAPAPRPAAPSDAAREDPYAGARGPDTSRPAASAPRAAAVPAKSAEEHLAEAQAKMNARDGKGCLVALDAHDQIASAPDTRSTSAAAFHQASTRGQCLMLNGQCDAGKALFRLAYTLQYGTVSPAQVDSITESHAGMFCPKR